jgi:hypothetical protein
MALVADDGSAGPNFVRPWEERRISIRAAPITPQSRHSRRQSSHAFVIALKLGSILRHFKYCAENVFDLIEAALYLGYNAPQ